MIFIVGRLFSIVCHAKSTNCSVGRLVSVEWNMLYFSRQFVGWYWELTSSTDKNWPVYHQKLANSSVGWQVFWSCLSVNFVGQFISTNVSPAYGVFHICKGLSGIKCEDQFERVRESKTRGHSLKLKKFRSRHDLRNYSFPERIVDLQNFLVVRLNSFKNWLNKIRQQQMSFMGT